MLNASPIAQVFVAMSPSTMPSAVCSCASACSTPKASPLPGGRSLSPTTFCILQVQIEKAITHARLAGEIRIGGQEPRLAGVMLVEVFDDDARLRHHPIPRFVTQH